MEVCGDALLCDYISSSDGAIGILSEGFVPPMGGREGELFSINGQTII
jgi:hypothetical protein